MFKSGFEKLAKDKKTPIEKNKRRIGIAIGAGLGALGGYKIRNLSLYKKLSPYLGALGGATLIGKAISDTTKDKKNV